MMLFKLSFKNMKKSIKDYAIYFFTLILGVAIFYIFNAIDSQTAMLSLNESKRDIVRSLVQILSYISVFISFVLGFLIVYSNNFLIKRRKKEFGLYLTLGMSKKDVSMILVIETLFIGIISLVIGLMSGVLLSQFLSIFTAKMFEANLDSLTFSFSSSALVKTIIYFSIIFISVTIFNVFSISRHKLINLLTAEKKNEEVKLRGNIITFITFALSVLFLGYAYYKLFNNGLLSLDKNLLYMILAGSIGTFLLFFSLSGFLLKLFQRIKGFYYKNLNLFVLKQINNKINTSVFSTTIISLMLLLTIGILSGSICLSSVYNNDISENNLTDFTIDIKPSEFDYINNITTNNTFKNFTKEYITYNVYHFDGINTNSILLKNDKIELIKGVGENIDFVSPLPIILESEYNKIMKLYNMDEVNIESNEYYLTANLNTVYDYYQNAYEKNNLLTINNIKLSPKGKTVKKIPLINFSSASNYGTIILDDSYKDLLKKGNSVILGNFINVKDKEKQNIEFNKFLKNTYGQEHIFIITEEDLKNSAIGIKVILTYVGLYLGIICAISSATILAIGQLSESSDNKNRFRTLRQLGADWKMLKKALFTQISIAFIFPLIVAIIHAFFGLREVIKIIQLLGDIDLTKNILLTSLFIIIVYGGYLLATYICSKNIIKDNN